MIKQQGSQPRVFPGKAKVPTKVPVKVPPRSGVLPGSHPPALSDKTKRAAARKVKRLGMPSGLSTPERRRYMNSNKEGKSLKALGGFLKKTTHAQRKVENPKGLTMNERFRLKHTALTGEKKKALREKLQTTTHSQRTKKMTSAAKRRLTSPRPGFPDGKHPGTVPPKIPAKKKV